MSRVEKFERPRVVMAFLPTDTPERSTAEVDFATELAPLVKKGSEEEVRGVLEALTSKRRLLCWALEKDRSGVTTDELLERLTEYLALVRGLRERPASAQPPPSYETVVAGSLASGLVAKQTCDSPPPPPTATCSPLRHVVPFVWRDLLDVKGGSFRVGDTALEEASCLLAAAQCVLGRASREPANELTALALYTSLRKAAGLLGAARALVDSARPSPEPVEDAADAADLAKRSSFFSFSSSSQAFSKSAAKKDTDEDDTGHFAPNDLRLALPEAWASLALAQAQHITIMQASAKPHIAWSLLAALCVDTARRYDAEIRGYVDSLTSNAPGAKSVGEWAGKRLCVAFLRAHHEYKAAYFAALARYCVGAERLEFAVAETDENACAEALRALYESAARHADAKQHAEKFVSNGRAVAYVDPCLTVRLAETADATNRALLRARQLNDSIFHKLPLQGPTPLPEAKTLATAIEYRLPPVSHLWTAAAFDAFDVSKATAVKPGREGEGRCCLIS